MSLAGTVFLRKLQQDRENRAIEDQRYAQASQISNQGAIQAENVRQGTFDRNLQAAQMMGQQSGVNGEDTPTFKNKVMQQAAEIARQKAVQEQEKEAKKQGADLERSLAPVRMQAQRADARGEAERLWKGHQNKLDRASALNRTKVGTNKSILQYMDRINAQNQRAVMASLESDFDADSKRLAGLSKTPEDKRTNVVEIGLLKKSMDENRVKYHNYRKGLQRSSPLKVQHDDKIGIVHGKPVGR
jgi:hypothetical protein